MKQLDSLQNYLHRLCHINFILDMGKISNREPET